MAKGNTELQLITVNYILHFEGFVDEVDARLVGTAEGCLHRDFAGAGKGVGAVDVVGLVDLDSLRGAGRFGDFSPLAQGLLTDRYLKGIPSDSRAARPTGFLHPEDITPEKIDKIARLNTIAAQRGQSLAQMSLAWLLAKPEITSVITGASSVRQLDNNLQAIANTNFTPSELSTIDNIIL